MEEKKSVLHITFAFILLISHSHFCCCSHVGAEQNSRQTLEVVIGGVPIISMPPAESPDNGDCPDCCPPPQPPPPPPPPECPPPTHAPPPPPKISPPPPHSPPKPPKKSPPPSHSPPKPPPSPHHNEPSSQYDELLMQIQIFRNRIKSDPTGITKTWTGRKICSDKSKYVGFICEGRRVVAFDFNLRNFSGGVPGNPPITFPELFSGAFKDLAVFHANSNFFTGDIPTKISKLRKLFEFDLSNNKFNGTFPNAVLGATKLEYLDLRYNNYTGPIPAQVFTLNLDVLFLNNNAFSGNIPENLGQSSVVLLTLANNKLTGQIPNSVGEFRNLDQLVLFNNKLSGCLPYEIGLLNKTTLFDSSNNQLTGPIPKSFGCLDKMQLLNLSSNHFYGIVPESLCCLENLVSLELQFNYFTQVGARCRELIKKGILDVSMNCIIDLPSQRSADECKRFFSVKRTCPNPKSFEYEPCSIDVLSASDKQQATTESTRKKARAASPAYRALDNNIHD